MAANEEGHSSADELVAALREEIRQHGKKFDEWKSKAQASVEKHRQQIVALNAQVEELRKENQLFRSQATESGSLVWSAAVSVAFTETVTQHAELFSAARDAEVQALKAQCQDCATQFEKYRKRAEQTLRLNSKDQAGLTEEAAKLKEALEQSIHELNEAREAVNQRNIALAVLEQQLDVSNSVVETLQSKLEQRPGNGSESSAGLGEMDLNRIRRG